MRNSTVETAFSGCGKLLPDGAMMQVCTAIKRMGLWLSR